MAVLEAVRGYEYYAGLPAINDRDRAKEEDGETKEEEESKSQDNDIEPDEWDDEWTKEQLEKDLDNLLNTDLESLLIEHDHHVGAEKSDSLRESTLDLLVFCVLIYESSV